MFNEKDHPRDGDGKFTEKDVEREKLADAIRKYSDTVERDMRDMPSPKGKSKSQDDFFGEEFKGVKGAAAIDKLLQEKRGHVKNAFERPEIGGIDLVWGDDSGGLLHTIQRRDKLLANGTGTISGLDMVKKIPEIIENGKFGIEEKTGRPFFDHDNYMVLIKPTFDGKKLNWVLSAMERL